MYRDGRRKNFYDGKGHMGLVPDLALGRAVGQPAARHTCALRGTSEGLITALELNERYRALGTG
jgi:hypothetical protein